jgi:hypothetical protein
LISSSTSAARADATRSKTDARMPSDFFMTRTPDRKPSYRSRI